MERTLPPDHKPTHRTSTGRPGTGRAAARRRHRQRTRLFDPFRGPGFTLLGLGERCAPALGDIEFEIVKPYLVGPGGLLDDDGHVADAYGTDALILVRPDGHIGLVADPTEMGSVGEYLRAL